MLLLCFASLLDVNEDDVVSLLAGVQLHLELQDRVTNVHIFGRCVLRKTRVIDVNHRVNILENSFRSVFLLLLSFEESRKFATKVSTKIRKIVGNSYERLKSEHLNENARHFDRIPSNWLDENLRKSKKLDGNL